MTNSIFVLLPPLIVLISTFLLRNLNMALTIGLISAALIACNFSLAAALKLLIMRFNFQITDIDTFYNYSFLLSIGIMIALLNATGGALAFAHSITRHLRSAKMVESSSLILSTLLFIDDYLSNLTGYVMRPLTDKFAIPRAKLALLVHSMAEPIVILAPISTWAAMITGQLEQAGISAHPIATTKIIADPFLAYIKSIPFIFYSLFIIGTMWFIVYRRISLGSMYYHEKLAKKNGDLFGGKKPINPPTEDNNRTGSLLDFIIPLLTLISSVVLGILWYGDFYLFGGQYSFLEAFKHNTQTFLILFYSGLLTLFVGFGLALVRHKIIIKQCATICLNGINLMYGAIIMVFLASTLGIMLRIDLQTGTYLADLLLGSVPLFLLPLMFFITSTLISLTIGSAWGTIALMLPLAIPMIITFTHMETPTLLSNVPLLLPILGAIFSGSVCGDHISPVSAITIMAAASAGTYPLDHVITQLPYAIPAILCACISFFCAGYLIDYPIWINASISGTTGIITCLFLLAFFNKNRNK